MPDLSYLQSLLLTPKDKSTVLIAIDFERKWKTGDVTEVGLSTLDMSDISSTTLATPGGTLAYVDTLTGRIDSYHLRIARWYRWVNVFPCGSSSPLNVLT